MTTPDEMREMAERLEKGNSLSSKIEAAAMLRSIAEEREVSRQRLSEVAEAAIAVVKGPML